MNKSKLLKRNIYSMKSHYSQIWVSLIMFGMLLIKTAIAEVTTVVQFQPPPEEEQPKKTEGAASRQLGQCSTNQQVSKTQSATAELAPLTTLVPRNNHGLTTQERPNFWLYLPHTSARRAILSIKEAGKAPHWQQSVELNQKQGIVGIELAKDAPALEIGKNYQWAVVLVCGDRPSPNDPVVASWIKRVDVKGEMPSTGIEKAAAYATQGIWYDALNVLATERTSVPNWQKHWQEYLQSGGLETIADEPIVDLDS